MIVAEGTCSYCGTNYKIPCKSMENGLAAVQKAGWIIAVKGDDVRIACPNTECFDELKLWYEKGLEEPRLDFGDKPNIDPGTGEVEVDPDLAG